MTLVFAAGVGTVILPIGLGAAAISQLLIGYHFWIFGIVGLGMVAVGVATLAGWKMMLPMPSGRGGGKGVGSVYGLGVFSGVASACCAPVLAGVAVLSGATSSLPSAIAVGVAYVFGMVAPLCILALLWDRKNWGASRLLVARTVPLWFGRVRRVPLVTAISGGLMIAMGVITVLIAIQGPGMAPDGWQVEVSAALSHAAASIQSFLAFVPGWLSAVAIFGALVFLLWKATTHRRKGAQPRTGATVGAAPALGDDHSGEAAVATAEADSSAPTEPAHRPTKEASH